MGDSTKRIVLGIFTSVSAILVAPSASAQTQDILGQLFYEYGKKEGVERLSDEGIGERISLSNGYLSFAQTDLSIKGNNSLPVEITRVLLTNGEFPRTAGFGEWHIDLPNISAVYTVGKNSYEKFEPAWVSKYNGQYYEYARCSSPVEPNEYWWNPPRLHIPGYEDNIIVKNTKTTPQPAGATDWKWITNNLTVLSCLPVTKNPNPSLPGTTGEGFLAMDQNGTKYWLDWMAASITTNYKLGNGPSDWLARDVIALYASRVEDKNGNWVEYKYSNLPNERLKLVGINTSDQRNITIAYNSYDQIEKIVYEGRVWMYKFTEPTQENRYKRSLAEVIFPDGQSWKFKGLTAFQPLSNGLPESAANMTQECPVVSSLKTDTPTATITTPSGATVEYVLKAQKFGRSNVPYVCQDGRLANMLDSGLYALASKTIRGFGIPDMTWSYQYESVYGWAPFNSGYDRTTITYPDGSKVVHTYGNSHANNEGLLLKKESLNATGAVMRTEVYEYGLDASNIGKKIGDSFAFHGNGFSAETIRPTRKISIKQDGAEFAYQANGFDSFARPTSIVRSSSLGYSRGENTSYFDSLNKWVLGRTKSVTCIAPSSCANKVISQTDYDSTSALPIRTYAFGALQAAFTYNADGTVASVSDARDSGTFDTTVTFSNWVRGTPEKRTYPATPDQPTSVTEAADVDGNGWVRSVTDENGVGFTTKYDYDGMGRTKLIDYPDGDTVNWNNTTQSFAPSTSAYYGLPAGAWLQIVETGKRRHVRFFDSLWRPVVEDTYDNTSDAVRAQTRSIVVKRYDTQGRLVFHSYPVRSLTSFTDTSLKGITTSYDALGRPTTTKQDSELGVLTTTTEYLGGFQTRVTNPRGQKTTTSYMAWDEPITDFPVSIDAPEGVRTTLKRDAFGKVLEVTRSGPDQ